MGGSLGTVTQEHKVSHLLEKCKWGRERGAPRRDGLGFGGCFLTESELDLNNTTGRPRESSPSVSLLCAFYVSVPQLAPSRTKGGLLIFFVPF